MEIKHEIATQRNEEQSDKLKGEISNLLIMTRKGGQRHVNKQLATAVTKPEYKTMCGLYMKLFRTCMHVRWLHGADVGA